MDGSIGQEIPRLLCSRFYENALAYLMGELMNLWMNLMIDFLSFLFFLCKSRAVVDLMRLT